MTLQFLETEQNYSQRQAEALISRERAIKDSAILSTELKEGSLNPDGIPEQKTGTQGTDLLLNQRPVQYNQHKMTVLPKTQL